MQINVILPIILVICSAILGLFTDYKSVLKKTPTPKVLKKKRTEGIVIISLIMIIMFLGIIKIGMDEKARQADEKQKIHDNIQRASELQIIRKQYDSLLIQLKQLGYKQIPLTREIVKIHKPLVSLTKNTISGFVYDSNESPLPNVILNITGIYATITTDEKGMFHFEMNPIPNDYNYSITYHKSGYAMQTYTYTEVPKTNIAVFLKPK